MSTVVVTVCKYDRLPQTVESYDKLEYTIENLFTSVFN